jgi:hypothetical protein
LINVFALRSRQWFRHRRAVDMDLGKAPSSLMRTSTGLATSGCCLPTIAALSALRKKVVGDL